MVIALGAFDLVRPAARGGMARVWQGVHRRSGVPVAVKVVTAELAREMAFRVRFAHEVRAVARLDHPAVVRVFDHGAVSTAAAAASGGQLWEGAPYLAMEWIEGGEVSSGVASWAGLRATLGVLLDGLAHAHARGVIHRDIKDDNVLRAARGPVLTDFGLAVDPAQAAGGKPAGTPGYMAPEQAKNEWRRFGPATDLYSLGCLAWRLWCGAVPYGEREGSLALMMARMLSPLPPVTPRFEAPAGFAGWLGRMLAVEPEDRFAFAADAAAALGALDGSGGSVRAVAEGAPRLSGVGRALFGHRVAAPVGREGARARLSEALDAVVGGAGMRVVVVEGASGQGKTHLASWLAERAHVTGAARGLWARHQQPAGADDGLGAMWARALGCADGDRAAVVEAVGRLGRSGDAAAAAELCALAVGGEAEVDGVRVRLGGPADWDGALVAALRALAVERPVLVVVDDVQWGAGSRRALRAALAHGPELPVLWVLTVRTDAVERGGRVEAELEALAGRADVERVRLGPLDAGAHRRLVQAMLPLDEATTEALCVRTAGNPLFAVELVRYWIGAGLLVDGAGGYRLAAEGGEAFPRGLQAMWTARLAQALGAWVEAAMPALEVAATLGLSVDGAEWGAACRAAGVEWPRVALERLLDARLVSISPDGRWVFAHAMLRETLQAQARGAGRARRWASACADVLAGAAPARVAAHLLAAGRDEEALGPLAAGVEGERLGGDIATVRRLLGWWLGALRRLGARPGDGRWLDLRLHWLDFDRREGRFARSARRAGQALASARRLGDVGREAQALMHRGSARYYLGDGEGCLVDQRAALALARRGDDRRFVVMVMCELGSTATLMGRLDEGEAVLLEALRMPPVDDGSMRARCLYYLGGLEAHREWPAAGITLCRAAREAWLGLGVRQLAAIAATLEGDLHRRAGDLEAAVGCYEVFFAEARMVGPAERAYRALDGALVALAQGRFAEARAGFLVARGEGLTTVAGAIAMGVLACAAGVGDWAAFDEGAAGLGAVLGAAPPSPDVPWAAEIAARAAEGAGASARAGFCRRVAVEQRARLQGR